MRLLRKLLRLIAAVVVIAVFLPPALVLRLGGSVLGPASERFALRHGVRLQALWARGMLRAIGARLDLEGSPPRGRHLVVANHVSYLDILVLAALFPGRFVAMVEISRWRLFGTLAKSTGTIFVDRSRRRDVVRVGEEMRRSLDAGATVILFPEAHASSGADVRPFHSSLFEIAEHLEVPCLPVGLSYATPGEPWAAAYTVGWWGRYPLFAHIVRLTGLRRIRARVRWGAPVEPGRGRKALARDCWASVRNLRSPMAQEPAPPGDPRVDPTPSPGASERVSRAAAES